VAIALRDNQFRASFAHGGAILFLIPVAVTLALEDRIGSPTPEIFLFMQVVQIDRMKFFWLEPLDEHARERSEGDADFGDALDPGGGGGPTAKMSCRRSENRRAPSTCAAERGMAVCMT
jgi:hypothetical protein